MIDIVMPALPGTKPNVIASIFIKAGDSVIAGQELFSVETSKRAVPIAAPTSGTVVHVYVREGEVVAAQDVLAQIDEGSEPQCTPDDSHVATPESPRSQPAANPPAGATKRSSKESDHAELLIIGGGVGGYVAAIYAAKKGKHVTLVERNELGGTCLNRGCIPTKSLISSASLHRNILRASEWGLVVDGPVRPDMRAIIARKDRVVAELVKGVEYLMDKNCVRVLRGTARFDGDDTVVVTPIEHDGDGKSDRRFSFDDCIVATGSAIRPLSLPGADLPEVLDTDRALNLATLPSSIVVVGGGVTGAEFAFMYADLGTKVTLVARRNRLLHLFDEDASEEIMRSASTRGISVQLGGDVKGFSRQQDGSICTTFEANGETHSLTSEYVLVAGGRIPTTGGVGLETTGIALDDKTGAILVDEHMRTSIEHVYAIGDVNGRVMLAHAASYQGRLAVDAILGLGNAFTSDIIPSVVYTDPEVAAVGVGVDEARRAGTRYSIGTFSFAHNGKALAENNPVGYVALVSDGTGKLRGATIVGGHASALIGYIAMAISAGLSSEDLRKAVFAHPTTAEALHEAACDLSFGALHE